MVMYFSPHILQVLAEEKPKYDSNGQVIVKPENNTWETIGVCRCDDDNTQELKSDNGDMYMSHYHIVYEGRGLKEGSNIRCLFGETVKAEGIARNPTSCNYFNDSEVWICLHHQMPVS